VVPVTELEFAVRLAVGMACGVGIGLERQWRQRLAGLRTTALVATGACLFVILSDVHSAAPSADRISAQIVSGIGFLGAGVILRDGLGIRGLNTAATLWCAAAVGALAGAGFFLFAAGGAAAVILANLFLRPLARRVDRRAGRPGGEAAPCVAHCLTDYPLRFTDDHAASSLGRAEHLGADGNPGAD
jgi:putative Mg2+ transporter-C (MgtC) family protein